MKKYKRFIIIIFIFLLTFNTVTEFKRQEAQAEALSGIIGSLMLSGSADALAGAIVVAGPYVAAFALLCIAAGVVYNNREEIEGAFINAYNYSHALGKNLLDFFSTDSNGKVTIKSEGVNLIKGSVKNYIADSNINGIIGEYSISPGTTSKHSIVNVSFPTTNQEDFIILNLKGSPVDSPNRPKVDIYINGTKIDGLGTLTFNSSYVEGLFVGLKYDSTGWKIWTSFGGLSGLKSLISKNPTGDKLGSSICSDLSFRVDQSYPVSADFNLSRVFDSLGDTKSVDSEVTFRNQALDNTKDVSVSVPSSVTWDNVIGKTYDNSIPLEQEGTSEGTVPGEGTGIWDWLKNLLNSILDAIKSIPGSIINFLKSILNAILSVPGSILAFFTIDWSLIAEHIVYDDIFKEKFKPFYDLAYLLQNINANPQTNSGKFYMVIPSEMGGDGKEHCVLDLTVANSFIVMGRTFINASIWIGFLWYILKLFSPKLNIG